MQALCLLLITATLLSGIVLVAVWMYRSATRPITKGEEAVARQVVADAIARASNPPGSLDA